MNDKVCSCGNPECKEREVDAGPPSSLTAMLSIVADSAPEKITRFERIVCALIRSNQFHSGPQGLEELLYVARFFSDAVDGHELGGKGIKGWTRARFTEELERQLFKCGNVYQERAEGVAKTIARVFYGD